MAIVIVEDPKKLTKFKNRNLAKSQKITINNITGIELSFLTFRISKILN